MIRVVLSLIFVLHLPVLLKAQLQITYPYQRMVIQRDLSNQANLQIAGNIALKCDLIQIKLESYNGFPASPINWTTLDASPSNGIFQGELIVRGGWYKITVRAMKNGQIVATDVLEPFGVGEVFLISGQSNAEGNVAFAGATKGTTESRVITVDYTDIFLQENLLPYRFTPLANDKKIGPYHNVPWIWAAMAENLVKTYQVPVLLFGASVGGMGSDLWYGSSRGIDYTSQFGRQVKFPGSPYAVISRTLKNYISFTGLRAILWQQGESDRLTSEQDYVRNISYIINQTRFDLQENIPWIIAESSRKPNLYSQVINAQKRLVQEIPNCFKGPNTDQLFGPFFRADGIHFHNQGIIRAGELWFEAIRNQNLLDHVPPVSPKQIVSPQIQCAGENTLTIGVYNPQLFPAWSNNTFEKSTSFSQGNIGATVRDNIGIRYPFPNVSIDTRFLRRPSLIVEGNLEFCDGDSIVLRNSENEDVNWSTNEITASIVVKKTGNYSFQHTNAYGCLISATTKNIVVNAKPEVSIQATSKVACEGDTIKLSSSSDFPIYNWSNGEVNKETTITTEGTLGLFVQNEKRCQSDTVYFEPTFLARPDAPTINPSGVFGIETLTDINDSVSIEWFLNDTLLSINSAYLKGNKPGLYKARILQTFRGAELKTCISLFSNSISLENIFEGPRIRTYPIPNEGSLTIETFDNFEQLTLTLYDMKGHLAFQKILNGTSLPVQIDLSTLHDGSYVLEARTKTDVVRTRLILMKSN